MKFFVPVFLSFCFFSNGLKAEILDCKGYVDLWIRKKAGWQKTDLKSKGHLEISSAEVGAVQVGTYLKYPSVIVYPFFGIKAEVKSKNVKFSTDNKTFFKITSDDRQLFCEVKSEASP